MQTLPQWRLCNRRSEHCRPAAKAWTLGCGKVMAGADPARRQTTCGQVRSSRSAMVRKWAWYKVLLKGSPTVWWQDDQDREGLSAYGWMDVWRQQSVPRQLAVVL